MRPTNQQASTTRVKKSDTRRAGPAFDGQQVLKIGAEVPALASGSSTYSGGHTFAAPTVGSGGSGAQAALDALHRSLKYDAKAAYSPPTQREVNLAIRHAREASCPACSAFAVGLRRGALGQQTIVNQQRAKRRAGGTDTAAIAALHATIIAPSTQRVAGPSTADQRLAMRHAKDTACSLCSAWIRGLAQGVSGEKAYQAATSKAQREAEAAAAADARLASSQPTEWIAEQARRAGLAELRATGQVNTGRTKSRTPR